MRALIRLMKWLGLAFLALVAIAGFYVFAWSFTSFGQLDYVPAVLARLVALQSPEPDFSPEARSQVNALTRSMIGDPVPLAKIEDRVVEANGVRIPVRIYSPDASGPLPLYLDIHGGGWWMGNGFVFDAATTRLAADAHAIVVSVDYRLAPEHPYPAALDDCAAVLDWMHANAPALGGDPERIAIGGASAGGNLAAALALRVRDRGGPKLRFQVLLLPATDLTDQTGWASYEQTGDDYVLTVSGIEQMIDRYVPDPSERTSPYVSPYLAEDLSGLPPALVVTALFDPLRDQGEAYAGRLREAGVPVTLHREPGALHGFMGSPDRMERVQSMAADALRAALEG